ncbi:MAG: DUF885 domain-containing protein [Ferruginibacter sp.]
MKKIIYAFALALFVFSCSTKKEDSSNTTISEKNKAFLAFENVFLDAYWKQYPSASINIGYGKYYDKLVIPDSNAVADNISFSKQWIDSLNRIDYNGLNDNNKISFNIIKNQLESDGWYLSVFKQYEWDATQYNLGGDCYYIINQPYAGLDERLRILSKRLQHADEYYKVAFKMLHQPTKEHVELSILQNKGSLSIFGQALTDSISASHLTDAEKTTLTENVNKTVAAINGFVDSLNGLMADKNYSFRSFRIGKKLFEEKFKYDLATNLTPQEIYDKATADKKLYYNKMFHNADTLWAKYFRDQPKPKDTLTLIQSVIDRISLQHATPATLFDTLVSQVQQLKKFILAKNLFDFDTTYPLKVRIMPEYQRGFAAASAEFTPPYQKNGETYYNIDDISKYSKEKAEGELRETNNYASWFLSIHEAIPGHCLQGIYNNKRSPDVLRSVFQNGAMIEGWAVYTETMMLENGFGNHAPELEMMHDKLKLRELANVIIDYDIQCLDKPKEDIIQLLTKECFQTNAQAEEKYHRATVSQVQLCSYYTGASSIYALRDEYKKKMGDQYSLKDFHSTFLSFGSSPVKYIRERMLK